MACCFCGESIAGITVHDFKLDKERTSINWAFCPNCSLGTGIRLIRHALKPKEWSSFIKKAGGITFLTHEDFYGENGEALQPHK